MKPNTTEAMSQLIDQIRTEIPLDLQSADTCSLDCNVCSFKLLEYLNSELDNWEYRLENGDIPNFHDLSRLAKSGKNIHRVLTRNGLIQ